MKAISVAHAILTPGLADYLRVSYYGVLEIEVTKSVIRFSKAGFGTIKYVKALCNLPFVLGITLAFVSN